LDRFRSGVQKIEA
jgi:hypothetical protein